MRLVFNPSTDLLWKRKWNNKAKARWSCINNIKQPVLQYKQMYVQSCKPNKNTSNDVTTSTTCETVCDPVSYYTSMPCWMLRSHIEIICHARASLWGQKYLVTRKEHLVQFLVVSGHAHTCVHGNNWFEVFSSKFTGQTAGWISEMKHFIQFSQFGFLLLWVCNSPSTQDIVTWWCYDALVHPLPCFNVGWTALSY